MEGEANVAREAEIRYSLKPVEPVQPSSDKWRRTKTTDEVMSRFPSLWNVAAEESETRNPTQIKGTVKSYRKIYDFLKSEGFHGTILDASSGLGYGTKAGIEEYSFHVEDIEPYPDKNYHPKYTDYSSLNRRYDVIISNAVLNVIPQDQRDALVVKMGQLLKDGGRMFINVRGSDVENASSKVAINKDLMEYYISNTGSYQKGFTRSELTAYLQDALGDGFTVKPTNLFGSVSAIVEKKTEKRLSLQDGKWKPTLDQTEWKIVNRAMESKAGERLTRSARFFFRNEKGKAVFGIYSEDDSTLLYAVHREKASLEYDYVKSFKEDIDHGTFSGSKDVDRWSEGVWMRQGQDPVNDALALASGRYHGNDDVYGKSSRRRAGGALRNLLGNLFQERSDNGSGRRGRLGRDGGVNGTTAPNASAAEESEKIFSFKDDPENFVEDKYYSRQIDNIENLKEGSYITVGQIRADSPLNQVGIPDGKLFFDVSKILKEMSERNDPIPPEKMKEIPGVLNDPIVITEYIDKQGTPAANVYGKLYIGSSPVVIGVMITKSQKGVLINKIQTVHPNRNFAREMTAGNILYLTPNKKEAG